uniref:Paraneoplastic antigen Ma-like C-terminal domain-containing protein n=1 Tax=Biomphalaria glabrata TaxID=6526 RepID=A0A2C9M637_BIOGL
MEGNMVEPSSVKGRDVGPMCSGGEPEGMERVTKGMLTRLQAELEALKLACQRPHYIIEPARKIRHFSGDGRNVEVSIEDFVREIRDLWELRPYLSPQEKTATILENISGPARVEVDLQPPHIRSDPESLLDALTSAFEVIIPVREAEITFLMSQQRRRESLLEFSHRLFKEFTTAIRQEQREGIECFKEE